MCKRVETFFRELNKLNLDKRGDDEMVIQSQTQNEKFLVLSPGICLKIPERPPLTQQISLGDMPLKLVQ